MDAAPDPSLSDVLKALRVAAGKSARDAGEAISRSRATIYAYESGGSSGYPPGPVEMEALLLFYGCSAADCDGAWAALRRDVVTRGGHGVCGSRRAPGVEAV